MARAVHRIHADTPAVRTLSPMRAHAPRRQPLRHLETLRGATWQGGSRQAPPAVSEAIDRASRALLGRESLNALHDEAHRVSLRRTFAESEAEVRGIMHA